MARSSWWVNPWMSHVSFVRFWERSTFPSFVSRCGPWALLEAVIEAVVRAWSSVSNTWSAASQRLGPKMCFVPKRCFRNLSELKIRTLFFFNLRFFFRQFFHVIRHQTSDVQLTSDPSCAARWGLARLRLVGSQLGSLVPTPGLWDGPTAGASYWPVNLRNITKKIIFTPKNLQMINLNLIFICLLQIQINQ